MTAAATLHADAITQDDLRQRHEALVNAYSPLVRRVAYRVLRRLPEDQISVELDDLINIGMIGLFDAATKYDSEAGQSFESFAEFRIRGAMLDELRRRDFFPRRLRAKANKLNRAEAALRTSLDREPTSEEVAEAMEMSVSALQRLRNETQPYSFVDQSDPVIQLRSRAVNPFQAVANLERHHLLIDALSQLSSREQFVLDMHFNQDISQRDIAAMLELTEGRISQIKSGALKKLRGVLARVEQEVM